MLSTLCRLNFSGVPKGRLTLALSVSVAAWTIAYTVLFSTGRVETFALVCYAPIFCSAFLIARLGAEWRTRSVLIYVVIGAAIGATAMGCTATALYVMGEGRILARPSLVDWTGIVVVSSLLATVPAVYGGPMGAVVATVVDERAEIEERIQGLTARARAFAIENKTALILTVISAAVGALVEWLLGKLFGE